ncbi:hypothetical protein HS088_TW19G00506 [Tripterygium wilfordii]|uniref:Small ribosomal subunit protein mS38 n=1 Tax=Tripterygium wilfordii TaxID=458696 RepID=A0A7J7C9Q7_TRIWF|nr:uncharacterized protein LOC119985228 [Tripterygium wilfordii]KAF5730904.1 hypothetical protein HS088_TW19G00506 [Tripterygium wilfordii]
MANLIQKLVKNKSSSLRIIASFKTLQPPKPTSALNNPLQTHLNTAITDQLSLFKSAIKEDPTQSSQVFYPTFPSVHCLNPVLSTGFCQSGDVVTDDARTVWADSVKKKRKKKMNKHKYKKLRKRLRRKSRA